MLETISKCLLKVQAKGTIIEKVDANFQQCHQCQKKHGIKISQSMYCLKTHCKACPTAVTQTKMGPCLIFKRRKVSQETSKTVSNFEFFVVDLIPVFPVDQFDNLKLYDNVISYLVNERPPFWLKYFNSMIKQVKIFCTVVWSVDIRYMNFK
jgi:hypothetical protein